MYQSIMLTHMSVTEGPAGTLLNLMDRHPMRPAHIHLMVSYISRFLMDFFQSNPRCAS